MQPDNGHGSDDHGNQGNGPNKFHYFVDDVEYDSDHSSLTGAQIKARIANFDPSYQLVLEGHGNDHDRVISDSDTISLGPPPPHFYSAPPANFG